MINNKVTQQSQHCIKKYCQASSAYRFFNLLTSDQLLETVDSLLPDHRERLFPPTETLSMFLSEDRSCQRVVNESAVNRAVSGLPQ